MRKQQCGWWMLRVVWVTVFWLSLWSSLSAADRTAFPVGSREEWGAARRIIMHTPGQELQLGIYHPAAALFERPFSIPKAAREHRQYIKLLEQSGVVVHTVTDTLLQGTIDQDGNAIESKELDELRRFARQFITVDASDLPASEQQAQQTYIDQVVTRLDPQELVAIILNQPTIKLQKTGINTGYAATYLMNPVMNLYFCRDQMITTEKGVVLGQMNSVQRAVETRILRFVLHKLGIKPIYEVTGTGRLEGGDFLPAGDTVFIGQGLRTNAEAIRQLLANDVFGRKRVVVCRDSWQNQDQMHLDTYFNIIDRQLAVCVASRLRLPDHQPAPEMVVKVDVYEFIQGRYQKTLSDGDFQDFLEKTMGMKIIPVSPEDQLRYGVNFLTIGPKRMFGVDGVSAEYKAALKAAGADVTWLDFSNLTGGYGAAHCMTQVIHRAPATQLAGVPAVHAGPARQRLTEALARGREARATGRGATDPAARRQALLAIERELTALADEAPLYRAAATELRQLVRDALAHHDAGAAEPSEAALQRFLAMTGDLVAGTPHDPAFLAMLRRQQTRLAILPGLIGPLPVDRDQAHRELLAMQQDLETAAAASPLYASLAAALAQRTTAIRGALLQLDDRHAAEVIAAARRLVDGFLNEAAAP